MGFNQFHLLAIVAIVLILFGPKNLPKLAQAVGQSVRELKKGLAGVNEDLRDTGNDTANAKSKPKPATPDESEAQPVERQE